MSLKKAQAISGDCQKCSRLSLLPRWPALLPRVRSCGAVCAVQTYSLSDTRAILTAHQPSSQRYQHGTSLRVRGEQLMQLPFRHLHKSGGVSFPEQAGAPPTRRPTAPLPRALPRSRPCSGAASTLEQSRTEGKQSTHSPF